MQSLLQLLLNVYLRACSEVLVFGGSQWWNDAAEGPGSGRPPLSGLLYCGEPGCCRSVWLREARPLPELLCLERPTHSPWESVVWGSLRQASVRGYSVGERGESVLCREELPGLLYCGEPGCCREELRSKVTVLSLMRCVAVGPTLPEE